MHLHEASVHTGDIENPGPLRHVWRDDPQA
jgi:hypothetical protein